jgi:hypothetical protein
MRFRQGFAKRKKRFIVISEWRLILCVSTYDSCVKVSNVGYNTKINYWSMSETQASTSKGKIVCEIITRNYYVFAEYRTEADVGAYNAQRPLFAPDHTPDALPRTVALLDLLLAHATLVVEGDDVLVPYCRLRARRDHGTRPCCSRAATSRRPTGGHVSELIPCRLAALDGVTEELP